MSGRHRAVRPIQRAPRASCSRSRRRGQGLAEYVVIVVVVGIFCIGIFMAFGRTVQAQTATSTNKLTGNAAHNAELNAVDAYLQNKQNTVRKNVMQGN